MRIPTTLVTGSLGVGKTTAILAATRHRPPTERWAVLVNEFGSVGIDGALLSDDGSLQVREIAGGCICCTANVPLRAALVRLIREVKPDRLFVEPTGLAHPAAIVDVVRSPGIAEAIALRATLTLVDPTRFLNRGDNALLADQILAADVLVGNFADRTSEEVLVRFRSEAAKLDPGPLVVATTSFGEIDAAWLELAPEPKGLRLYTSALAEAHEVSLVWPPDVRFGLDALQTVLQRLVRPSPEVPNGVLRLKGIFYTDRGFLSVQATPTSITFAPVGWRRDSRVVLITPDPVPSTEAVGDAFSGARAP